MRVFGIAALTFIACLLSSTAQAGFQYGFWGITNNNAANVATGTNQLKVEVFDNGSNNIKFLFTNTGSNVSSITDIYFHDAASLFGSLSWIENGGSGVYFRPGANPNTLTGGSSAGFVTKQSLNSESSSISYGVNPGESVGLVLSLNTGRMFGEVTSALASSALRVGLQMRGFSTSGSESFVNSSTNSSPVPVTPEPSSLALAGLACIGLVWQKRKKLA